MIYVGFLLQTMGADYFPHLTEVIGDREAATRLLNDQLQPTWSLGFVFLAAAQPRLTLMTTLTFNAVFLSLIWLGLWPFGLGVTGIVFLVAQLIESTIVALLVRRLHDFRWQPLSLRLFGLHVLLAAGLLALSLHLPLAGAVAVLALGLGTGFAGGGGTSCRSRSGPTVAFFPR